MIVSPGKFNVTFLPKAFVDGMDLFYHQDRKNIKFSSTRKSVVFNCPNSHLCSMFINANSSEFFHSNYVSDGKISGFESIILGSDAKRIYEDVFVPWSEPEKKVVKTIGEHDIIEQEKLVFINYDEIGSIFCRKRFPETNPENAHYACWFKYNDAITIKNRDVKNFSTSTNKYPWSALDQQVEKMD
jgi:hypothetical protein